MAITLKQEQEKFILDKLQQGKYKSAEELLATAFQLLEENEQKEQEIIWLREKILEGKQQMEEGKMTDGEVVFQRLEEKLKRMQGN
ncbi:MAG: type II toxin-antitoxin system ParD family antitoxin [Snowella sp.]|jgi:antitoxin ParD1/3/4|nr:type II toxin-antitoxin system ParD family antitoxin [Snowella sp.]